jgi:hypothetical protein
MRTDRDHGTASYNHRLAPDLAGHPNLPVSLRGALLRNSSFRGYVYVPVFSPEEPRTTFAKNAQPFVAIMRILKKPFSYGFILTCSDFGTDRRSWASFRPQRGDRGAAGSDHYNLKKKSRCRFAADAQ